MEALPPGQPVRSMVPGRVPRIGDPRRRPPARSSLPVIETGAMLCASGEDAWCPAVTVRRDIARRGSPGERMHLDDHGLGRLRRSTANGANDEPSLSADGRFVAFSSSRPISWPATPTASPTSSSATSGPVRRRGSASISTAAMPTVPASSRRSAPTVATSRLVVRLGSRRRRREQRLRRVRPRPRGGNHGTSDRRHRRRRPQRLLPRSPRATGTVATSRSARPRRTSCPATATARSMCSSRPAGEHDRASQRGPERW